MPLSLAEAAEARRERILTSDIDGRIGLLLSNYQRVTANPRTMGYLHSLLKHYAKSPHPFTECVHDNMKRFGPGRTEGVCATLKDTIRQSTHWRGKAGHARDHGDPGVGIAEADHAATHHMSERPLTLLDELDAQFGVVDHCEPIAEAFGVLAELRKHCDPYRVLIGLDEPPTIALEAA